VEWEPFSYEATLGVTFALEVRLGRGITHTVAVNVGADLHVWGPPFSGRAQIHVGVMSFTIEFGEKQLEAPALDWEQFQERLLGPRETLLRLRVRDGLLGELARASYAVDAEQFEAATELAVPAKRVLLNGKDQQGGDGFDIAPMRLERAHVVSRHEIDIERWTGSGWKAYGDVDATVLRDGRLPKALWELQGELAEALGKEPTLRGLVTGVHLKPQPAAEPDWAPAGELQRADVERPAWAWEQPRSWATPPTEEEPLARLLDTIGQDSVAAERAKIVGDLLGDVKIDVAALQVAERLGLRSPPVLAAVAGARDAG